VQGVKRRGLALNINPLALLPGSKPLKTPTSALKSPTSPSTPPQTPPSPQEESVAKEPVLKPNPVPQTTTPDAASFDEVPSSSSQLSHLGKVKIALFSM